MHLRTVFLSLIVLVVVVSTGGRDAQEIKKAHEEGPFTRCEREHTPRVGERKASAKGCQAFSIRPIERPSQSEGQAACACA